ncbi:MAG TPA: GNAT family N-acetyltransferase [Aggregatilineales bacterium]|nr:GNAT family N-acetyltransferase [Aggregatilineales bacterium]
MKQQLDGGLLIQTLDEDPSLLDDLADFHGAVQRDEGEADALDVTYWIRDFASGRLPNMTHADIYMVIDPARHAPGDGGSIVSAINLIPQTWHYEDVPFGLGRIEVVATHKDYRHRRLVRAQIDAAHARSTELGLLATGITGIPNYYRRFGYTRAIPTWGRYSLPFYEIADGAPEHFTLRPAALDDADRLSAWDAYRAREAGVSVIRTPELWRYEISGHTPASPAAWQVFVIRRQATGEDVGHVALRFSLAWNDSILVSYVVGEGASYVETYSDVLRGIRDIARAYFSANGKEAKERLFIDSNIHPALDLLLQNQVQTFESPNHWYMRVPDLSAFLMHIAPVLERRLEGSAAHRYSGLLNIGFYNRSGLRLTFEQGRLVSAGQVAMEREEYTAAFADLTFLNVLFGNQTRRETRAQFDENYALPVGRVLIDTLFPRRPSFVIGVA